MHVEIDGASGKERIGGTGQVARGMSETAQEGERKTAARVRLKRCPKHPSLLSTWTARGEQRWTREGCTAVCRMTCNIQRKQQRTAPASLWPVTLAARTHRYGCIGTRMHACMGRLVSAGAEACAVLKGMDNAARVALIWGHDPRITNSVWQACAIAALASACHA
eukprot:365381-Chlamydomonas_euryale.AAC.14